ncbi:MAG: hypothetical protein AABX07_00305 [Nanoarchaeota archaeon]
MSDDLSSINRIVILNKNVKGDLSRCNVCGINFTAIQPCIICQFIIEKERTLGRKLTKHEFEDIVKGFCRQYGQ